MIVAVQISAIMASYTIDEAIDSLGLGIIHVKYGILLCLIFTNYIIEFSYLTFFNVVFQCELKTGSVSMTVLTGSLFTCFAVGCVYFGWLADKIGRIRILRVCLFGVFYFNILGINKNLGDLKLASDIASVILTKTVSLCFTGGSLVVSVVYCIEHFPKHYRGKFVLLFATIGTMLGYLILLVRAYFQYHEKLFQYYMLVEKTLPLFVFIFSIACFEESIRYNNLIGNYDETMRHLNKMSKQQNVPLPKGNLVMDQAFHFGNLQTLFNRKLYASTLCLIVLGSLLWSVYNGVLEWNLRMVSHNLGYLRYRTLDEVICQTSKTPTVPFIYVISMCFVEIPAMLLGYLTIECIGRRYTLLTIGTLSTLLLVAVTFNFTQLATIILLQILRGVLSLSPLMFLIYVAETYPTKIRSVGVGMQVFFAVVFSTLLTILTEEFVQQAFFTTGIVLMSYSAFTMILTILLPKDTKGKYLDR